MQSELRSDVWLHRGLYFLLGYVFIFIKILPLGQSAGDWPGPDLLLCLTMAWVIRRPDYLPAFLIALVILLTDLILMRPPGLFAFAVVLGTEFLRNRIHFVRELSLFAEWMMIAVLMMSILMTTQIIAFLTITPVENFGFEVIGVLASIAAYPIVVWMSNLLFKVHKPAMGEVDALGRRL
ncbi:MAG: rod shape-determining protein MreD [Paracoccaceae bacterium]